MGNNEKLEDLQKRIDFISSHIQTDDIAAISKTSLIEMIYKQNQFITDLLFKNDKLSEDNKKLKERMNLSNYIIHTTVYDNQIEEWLDLEMNLLEFIEKYTSEGDPFWNIT